MHLGVYITLQYSKIQVISDRTLSKKQEVCQMLRPDPHLVHICLFLFITLCTVLFAQPACAGSISRNVVVVSSTIKPYLLALDGIVDEFKDSGEPAPNIQYLNKFIPNHLADLAKIIQGKSPQTCITIGPEATSFAWKYLSERTIKKVYTMVAAPDTVLDNPPGSPVPSGISLDIPVSTQLQNIKCFLPNANRIGVLYNPAFSETLINKLQRAAKNFQLEIIPLAVHDTSEIIATFRQNIPKIKALLFIPDPVVTYKSIIRLLLKEGINRKIPTIGFNRFFYNNGSAISIIIDYYRTGRRTVTLLREGQSSTKNSPPTPRSPYTVTWPNYQVIQFTSKTNSAPPPASSTCKGIEVGP